MFIKALARKPQFIQQRNFATLVLAEHFEGKLNMSLGSCLTAAKDLNDSHVSFNQPLIHIFRLMFWSMDLMLRLNHRFQKFKSSFNLE